MIYAHSPFPVQRPILTDAVRGVSGGARRARPGGRRRRDRQPPSGVAMRLRTLRCMAGTTGTQACRVRLWLGGSATCPVRLDHGPDLALAGHGEQRGRLHALERVVLQRQKILAAGPGRKVPHWTELGIDETFGRVRRKTALDDARPERAITYTARPPTAVMDGAGGGTSAR